MAISTSKAKSLCNASELSLVTASARLQLAALSASQLRQKVAQSRKLHDKWRDQAERQRRAAQAKQGARQTSASARSAEKAQLFAEVLERFEKRLAKVGGESTTTNKTKSPPRKTRSAGHRADRAVVREELDQTRLEIKAAKQTSRTKTAAKKTAGSAKPTKPAKPTKSKRKIQATIAIPLGSPQTEDLATSMAADLAPSKKRSIGPVQTKAARSTSQLAAAQGLRVTDVQQGRIAARAKQDRLKAAGVIRIQKHSSARTKRRQGKRDAR
jgi:hypothetical protein